MYRNTHHQISWISEYISFVIQVYCCSPRSCLVLLYEICLMPLLLHMYLLLCLHSHDQFIIFFLNDSQSKSFELLQQRRNGLFVRQILTTLYYPDIFSFSFKVNFLAALGGVRPSDHESVRKMLRKLGNNSLWSGYSLRGKKAEKNLLWKSFDEMFEK